MGKVVAVHVVIQSFFWNGWREAWDGNEKGGGIESWRGRLEMWKGGEDGGKKGEGWWGDEVERGREPSDNFVVKMKAEEAN
jgi:hypothetical protein